MSPRWLLWANYITWIGDGRTGQVAIAFFEDEEQGRRCAGRLRAARGWSQVELKEYGDEPHLPERNGRQARRH